MRRGGLTMVTMVTMVTVEWSCVCRDQHRSEQTTLSPVDDIQGILDK